MNIALIQVRSFNISSLGLMAKLYYLYLNCIMLNIAKLCIKNIKYSFTSHYVQLSYLELAEMIVPILVAVLFLNQIRCCFIVHFVYYGELSDYDFLRISRFSYPYIFHLDEEITLPDNHTINRNLTLVEKSDVKKMEVIYHHGGLYLDNDHFIDT